MIGVISNWPISRSKNSTAQIKLCGRAGLLIRRHIADGDLAFFTTWCPAGTSIETLVAVEGHRWAIEDSFETAKNEFGLDHNESRSWHGWHRHVSLVMLAFAMMTAIRRRANPPPPKKTDATVMLGPPAKPVPALRESREAYNQGGRPPSPREGEKFKNMLPEKARSPLLIRMHRPIRPDLPRLRQLDHMHRRRIAALPA